MRIVIEAEVPQDCNSLFRVSVDNRDAGDGLTAIQAQLIAADAIEAFVFPQGKRHRSTAEEQLAALAPQQ